jgi:hypothetical protein
VQLAILALLIVDVACVVGEIIISLVCAPEVAALQAEVAKLTEELAAASHNSSGAVHHRLLQAPGVASMGARALRGLSEAAAGHGTVAVHEESLMHSVEHGLHIASLTILVIFAVQLLGLLVAFGVRDFVRHCFYLVDSVIVVTALVLESLSEPTGELIVLLLFWRVLRVLHGVMASELVAVERVEHVRNRLRAVRRRLWAARSYTATRLRLVIMHHAARNIWAWWRVVKSAEGGSDESAAAGVGAAGARLGGVVLESKAALVVGSRQEEGKAGSMLTPEEMHEAVEDAATALGGREGHWSSKLAQDERAVARRRNVDPRTLKARKLKDYVHNTAHDAVAEGETDELLSHHLDSVKPAAATAGTAASTPRGTSRGRRRLDHALDELEFADHELT